MAKQLPGMSATLYRETSEELSPIRAGTRWGEFLVIRAGRIQPVPKPLVQRGQKFMRHIDAELALPCCVLCRQPIHCEKTDAS
jgi:hypothetical protein